MPARTAAPAAVAAIEVRSDVILGALVDRAGRVLRCRERPTPDGGGAVVEAIREMATVIATWPVGRVVAAGVAVPGVVDVTAGVVRQSPQLGWHNVELGDVLSRDLAGAPVRVDQVVRAIALAESATWPAARPVVSDWLYLRVGPDIDAAAFVADRLQRGGTGSAGEVGHVVVYPFGELCACGQRGCVQVYASSANIERRYAAISEVARPVAEIAARVDRDPLANEVWSQACAALAGALAAYVMLNDPALIVVGGELASAGAVLLATLNHELRPRLTWRQAPRIALAQPGEDAGRTGAALLAWEVAGPAPGS